MRQHTPETIRQALTHVPSDDRDTWIAMGMAIKSELGDEGFSVWDEWSQSADSYRERDAKAVWKSIKDGGRITIGSLFYEAKQHGYQINGHGKEISAAEWDRIRQERELRQQAEAERKAKEESAAADCAEEILSKSTPATPDHPYLRRKGIQPCAGLRIGAWSQVNPDGVVYREKKNCLLVGMRDADGKLWNVQAIFPEVDATIERDKDYLLGGRKQGTYFAIGKPDGVVVIAEGLATALSIREATGYAVCVSFDKGNLDPVGRAIRAKLPDVRLIFAADNDIKTGKPNYGVDKANAAANEVRGLVAIPELNGLKADFNDLHQKNGSAAVKAAIDGARQPQQQERKMQSAKDGRIIYQCLSEIQAKKIHWLWPGRIARGKPTMLAGNPGLGKSQITASVAAIVTTGGNWPITRERCEKGSALFLSAEDDPADTIRPRLEAAGADITKVHILKAVLSYRSDGEEMHRAFNLKEDIRRLEAAIAEIGDVALVVIDPVSAYLGNGDSHNNAEVRALLAPLSEMASRQDAAILLVSHLNKGAGGGDALARVTGSLAFVAASRAAFIVAKDVDDPERRLFLPAKNNIAKDVGGLAFKIMGQTVGDGIETSMVVWESSPINDVTADDVLSQPTDPEEKGAREEAKAFLLDLLKDGSMPSKDVFTNARGAGVAEKTLRRAAQEIGVVKKKEGGEAGIKGGWLWMLPPKMANNPEDAHLKTEGNFGSGGHLQDVEVIE